MIAVIDFGGQYTHLIARRIRSLGVKALIFPFDVSPEQLKWAEGVVFSGGPAGVFERGAPKPDDGIYSLGVPVLGICYGHQLIAEHFGGEVKKAEKREFGTAFIAIKKQGSLFKGLGKEEQVWMSHGDAVTKLPKGFEAIAESGNSPIAAFEGKNFFGIQFHPEVVHTVHGLKVYDNFLDICKAKRDYSLEDFIPKAVEEMRQRVKGGRAIIALSGGVDSSVAAALAARALGERLTAIFVDNGLMRRGEPDMVGSAFAKTGIRFRGINAAERFLKKLKGVTDPEKKRKVIGEEFIRVFEEEAKKEKAGYLIQGTIYPDRIESAASSKAANVIKTHHNVGGLPTKIRFRGIIEPLGELYKDEVRVIGLKLGLPRKLTERQPFPGPGLAVRVVGEVIKEKLDMLRECDSIVQEEISKAKSLPENLWQSFAVFTGIRSTGVKGDSRDYGYVIALRFVDSLEAMTANFSRVEWELLERISTRITNEVRGVTRVVYDITNKPPGTIEWE